MGNTLILRKSLRSLLNIVADSNRHSKSPPRTYPIDPNRLIEDHPTKEQAAKVSCDDEDETSLRDKVDSQEKLLLSILDTVRRLEGKSRVFRCPARGCKSSYGRPDNLSRHIRSLSDDEHKHVASKIKSRFCSTCDKTLNRQCDYTRHMRSKHPDVDLGAWDRQQYALPSLIIIFVLFIQKSRSYPVKQQPHDHSSYAR